MESLLKVDMAKKSKSEELEVVEFNEVDPIRGPVLMKVYKKDQFTFRNTQSYSMKVQLAFNISSIATGKVFKDRPEKET